MNNMPVLHVTNGIYDMHGDPYTVMGQLYKVSDEVSYDDFLYGLKTYMQRRYAVTIYTACSTRQLVNQLIRAGYLREL